MLVAGPHMDRSGGEVLPGITPRQYQLDAAGVLQDLRAKGVERGLVTMATGMGKTAVGVLDVYNFHTEQTTEHPRFLFLTHRNEIIDQAWNRFIVPLAALDLNFRYLQPGQDIEGLQSATFMFASFQMMHRGRFNGGPIREIFDRRHFDYVLTDEAHHASAPTFEPTMKYFQPEFKLGLTATPDRRDTRNIRYIFGQEVFRKSLPEGIAEGYLARPHYIGIAPTATIKTIRDGVETEEKFRRIDRASVVEIAKDIQARTAHITDPKILVYTRSIQEADLYAELLPNAAALHSDTSRTERQDLIEDFRATRPGTLTSVDILNEGIDIPDVDVIVMARSTASETVFLQQLGRGLRKTAGKDEVFVLDYVANSERLEMIARLIDGFPKPSDEEDKEPRSARKRKRKVEEIINGPEIDLQNATFEFDASILDILQLLHDREARNRLIHDQTPEKSVAEYLALCEEHGKILPVVALEEILGRRGTELLLMPFEGRISDLRGAAGYASLFDHPEMVSVSEASRLVHSYYQKVDMLVAEMDIEIFSLMGINGSPTRSIKRENLEDIVRALHTSREQLSTRHIVPRTEITTLKVRDRLSPKTNLRAFRSVLRELGIVEHMTLGIDDESLWKVFKGSFNRVEEGRVRQYLAAMPTAQAGQPSIEKIAKETQATMRMAYWAAHYVGVKGKLSRSPSSPEVQTYITEDEAQLLRSYFDRSYFRQIGNEQK